MSLLDKARWNAARKQYELGENWRVKLWRCKERMRCEQESCKFDEVDVDAVHGIAVQIVGGGKQTKRSIPVDKLEWLGGNVKEIVEGMLEERMETQRGVLV